MRASGDRRDPAKWLTLVSVAKGGPAHDIETAMNTRYDPRADKITVAITEAIIASQRDHEHPVFCLRRDGYHA